MSHKCLITGTILTYLKQNLLKAVEMRDQYLTPTGLPLRDRTETKSNITYNVLYVFSNERENM